MGECELVGVPLPAPVTVAPVTALANENGARVGLMKSKRGRFWMH